MFDPNPKLFEPLNFTKNVLTHRHLNIYQYLGLKMDPDMYSRFSISTSVLCDDYSSDIVI